MCNLIKIFRRDKKVDTTHSLRRIFIIYYIYILDRKRIWSDVCPLGASWHQREREEKWRAGLRQGWKNNVPRWFSLAGLTRVSVQWSLFMRADRKRERERSKSLQVLVVRVRSRLVRLHTNAHSNLCAFTRTKVMTNDPSSIATMKKKASIIYTVEYIIPHR